MRVSQNQWRAEEESSAPEQSRAVSAELYQRYAPELLAYLCKRTSSLHDAEDILLDVFLAVLEYEAGLLEMPEEKQRAWLWTVARNRLTDNYRRKKRRPGVSLELVTDIVDEARTPEQLVLRDEEDEQLRRWIRQLSPQQQEVLALRFTGNLRCTEIAAIMHKREGAIRITLVRALNALRGKYRA